MSVNKTYGETMDLGVKGLIEHSNYDKVTNHATFDASKVEFPEGVTPESLGTHVTFINDLTAQAEEATAQIAREQFGRNDKLTTIDSTLAFDMFSINSQHHLRQQIGDDFIYGGATTIVDYVHTDEQATWLNTQRTANQELAEKLFG